MQMSGYGGKAGVGKSGMGKAGGKATYDTGGKSTYDDRGVPYGAPGAYNEMISRVPCKFDFLSLVAFLFDLDLTLIIIISVYC